jgi:hypothetical protein
MAAIGEEVKDWPSQPWGMESLRGTTGISQDFTWFSGQNR